LRTRSQDVETAEARDIVEDVERIVAGKQPMTAIGARAPRRAQKALDEVTRDSVKQRAA
jgi:hypothetical protein